MTRSSALAIAILATTTTLAVSHQTAKKSDNFRDGVLLGLIVDPAGKPIANATVAVQMPNSKALLWTKTGPAGEYVLCVKPQLALNLKPSHSRGILEESLRAVGDVAMAPVRIVADVVSNPGPVAKSAAVSVAAGNPGPMVVAGVAAGLPNGTTPSDTKEAAGGAAADAILSGPVKEGMPAPAQEGQATIFVIADGYKGAAVDDGAYWLDPPNHDKKQPLGVQARMQTIRLAATADAKGKSEVLPETVKLSDPVVKPEMVPIGGSLNLQVKLDTPMPDSQTQIRVFARLSGRNAVEEFQPVSGKPGLYECKFAIDKKCKAGPATIAIGALRSQPIDVKLVKRAKALTEFCRRTPDMDPGKSYGYDPFVMASQNRLDVKVNILPAKPSG